MEGGECEWGGGGGREGAGGEEEDLPPVAVATQKTGNSRRQQLDALHGQKGKKTFLIFSPLNVKLWAEILKSQSFTGCLRGFEEHFYSNTVLLW